MELQAQVITVTSNPSFGVNVVGFLEAESGLGEIARKLVAAIERTKIPCTAIPYDATASRQQYPLSFQTSSMALYDVNLICLNANELPAFAQRVGVKFFEKRYSIGVWFWETDRFRKRDRTAFSFIDEIWVPSTYVREAIMKEANAPVLVVPIPVEPPELPVFSRKDLRLPSGFLFLFLFDFTSGKRKNPVGLLDAFTRAFAPGEGPILVLKSINGRERKPRELEQLEAAAADRSDVFVLDGYASSSERDAFVAACDCFVSLHRSEGFGLTMAEAMSYGKPVIATGYSGNLEFMTEENSYLVPYDLVPVPRDWWAYAPGAVWAEPDVEAAACLMRRVWEHGQDARALGERARNQLLGQLSPDRTACFVASRLSSLHMREAIRKGGWASDARPPILEASLKLTSAVGENFVQGGGSPVTAFVRRLLGRALWPYLEDQRRFETSVLHAVTLLQRSVRELEQQVADLERLPWSDDEHY